MFKRKMSQCLIQFFLLAIGCILPNTNSQAQGSVSSPCPKRFVYDSKSDEFDMWYGVLTLFNESDLKGICLRLIFDRPALFLGNWFGPFKTKDNKVFLIKNPGFELRAHTPHKIRFYIKYNISEPPPRLVLFQQNAKTVCPDDSALEVDPLTQLQTGDDGKQQKQNQTHQSVPLVEIISNGTAARNSSEAPSINNGPSEDDEFSFDFFSQFNRPSSSLSSFDLNTACGPEITSI